MHIYIVQLKKETTEQIRYPKYKKEKTITMEKQQGKISGMRTNTHVTEIQSYSP